MNLLEGHGIIQLCFNAYISQRSSLRSAHRNIIVELVKGTEGSDVINQAKKTIQRATEIYYRQVGQLEEDRKVDYSNLIRFSTGFVSIVCV